MSSRSFRVTPHSFTSPSPQVSTWGTWPLVPPPPVVSARWSPLEQADATIANENQARARCQSIREVPRVSLTRSYGRITLDHYPPRTHCQHETIATNHPFLSGLESE